MKTYLPLLAGSFLLLVSWSAPGASPIPTTLNARNRTADQATLRGRANPKYAVTAFFEWGLTTNYGQVTATQSVARAGFPVVVKQGLSNLPPATTYHFRVVTSSSGQLFYGPDRLFKSAPAAPAVTTESADAVTPMQATLHGRVDPNGRATSVYFQWGISMNYGNQSDNQPAGSGAAAVSVGQGIDGLTPGANYHFRIVARNALGLRYGADAVFAAVSAPLVTTEAATDVEGTSVWFRGKVNPNALATTTAFEWGLTTNYGNRTPTLSAGSGAAEVTVVQSFDGLTLEAVYHFRMVASNALGVRYGNDVAVAAAVRAPLATTLPATDIQGASALLHAMVNPSALDAYAVFEWGLTTRYGNRTMPIVLPAGTNGVSVQSPLTSLLPGATYHFRTVASNSAGTRTGADLIFSLPCEANSVVATLPVCNETSLLTAISAARRVVFACDGTITLTSPIEVHCALVLDGSGQSVTLSGGLATRLFNVHTGASLTLLNLTMANGLVQGTNGARGNTASLGQGQPGESTEAGGILVSGATLIAGHCTFTNCAVLGGHGGDGLAVGMFPYGGGAGNATGGAISARSSSVTLSNCIFFANYAAAGLSGQNTFVQNNTRSPGNGNGGAISVVDGATAITHCQFRGNSATLTGGALEIYGAAGSTTVDGSDFVSNAVGINGGALTLQSGRLAVSRSTFHRNQAAGSYTFSAINGGAMAILSGDAVLVECDFATNTCHGGIGNSFSGNATDGRGGALAVLGGAALISRSSFRANAVYGDNGLVSFPFGQGPSSALGGAIFHTAVVRLTNCTLALNSAYPGHSGNFSAAGAGGAIAGEGGFLVLASCTLASNRVDDFMGNQSRGGALDGNGTLVEMINCLLSGNSVNATASSNVSGGTLVDSGHNLSSDATPAWTSGLSLNNTDPLLLPLADNGGLTWTMALRLGSPALDAADCAGSPATDQRGAARPDGPGCDIGAYEGPGVPGLQF